MFRSPRLYLRLRLGTSSKANAVLVRRSTLTADADAIASNSDKL
jgi:hypothetical protein